MDTHTVFRGATRPPMFMGIPLIPFALVSAPLAISLGWLVFLRWWYVLVFVILLWMGLLYLMNLVCKKDNWQLNIELMRVKRRNNKGNIMYWGSVSYSPFQLQRRF